MSTTVTKKEEARIKRATEFIDNVLRLRLKDFENEYLHSELRYQKILINKAIQSSLANIIAIQENPIKKHGWEVHIKNEEFRISKNEDRLKNDALLMLEVFTEAKKSYDKKINKIVSKLVEEGFERCDFNIEDIYDENSRLAFLISNSEKEVHARLIFAHGEIVSPHFRFITTARQK